MNPPHPTPGESGWFVDPDGAKRYWDGAGWTTMVSRGDGSFGSAPLPGAAEQAPPAPAQGWSPAPGYQTYQPQPPAQPQYPAYPPQAPLGGARFQGPEGAPILSGHIESRYGPTTTSNGLSIAGMVFGVAGIFGCLFGLIGIALAQRAIKAGQSDGPLALKIATAGFVVGLVVNIGYVVLTSR